MTDQQLPVVAPPLWDNIPPSLAQRGQWLLWRFEQKEGQKKPGKIPYYATGGRRTGGQGTDQDLARLTTLDVVRKVYDRGGWSGIGFAFLPGDGLIGIDLDGQRDPETGEWSERCKNIVAACASFTEVSPSGKGVHIFVQGETETNKSNDIGVEVFCGRQFFTVTANRFPNTDAEVQPISEHALRRLHKTIDEAKALHKEAAKAKAAPVGALPAPAPTPTASAAGPAPGGGDDFRRVNDAAMGLLHAWVPSLFKGRETARGNGYRVTSKALGRDLQEDLSIAPEGICDFGVADMGDPKAGSRTPIDLVMEHLPVAKPAEAMKWLAPLVGVVLTPPARSARAGGEKKSRKGAPAGGNEDAEDADAGDAGPPPGPPPGVVTSDGDDSWWDDVLAQLVKHRGKPLDCRENVLYVMTHDPVLKGLVRRNDFSQLIERSRATPWGHPVGEWSEDDDLMLGEYLLRTYRLGIKSKGTLRDGVMMAARLFRYNPVVDRIKAETWDGTDRIEHWMTDVYEVEATDYVRLISKCFMMGLVKRAIEPGCKFDYMLIIKGTQGLSKSGAFRLMAYPYFTDNAIRVGDKDSQMAQQLAWIVESAELESLNKTESTQIKQHLSAQEDWFRPPYGSAMVKAPRHSVHVGTTNADTFLKDATGDRRFWPLEVHVVNMDVLKAQLPQLLAEALHRVEAGEQYWPTREQEKALIFPAQEPFKRVDSWEDWLDEYVNAPGTDKIEEVPRAQREFFASTELYDKALGIKSDRVDGGGQMDTRIANAMKSLGFKKHRETTGRRRRGYLRLPKVAPQPGQENALAVGYGANLGESDGGDDDLPL